MADYPYRTVIDNVAEDLSLVDTDAMFAELGNAAPTAAQTAQMETVIAQASDLIPKFLDRVLAEQDVTDYFRALASDTLRLSQYPVVEILQVIENGVELTPDDWELDETTGKLWRISGTDRICWSSSATTTVSYVGGYGLPDGLPADIQRAAIDQVKAVYIGGPRDPTIRSESVPDTYQASYALAGGDNFGKSSGLLLSVEAALSRHMRMSV